MPDSQQFLRELDRKLWSAADRLRANLDAAVYSRAERDSLPKAARRVDAEASSNHAVLGLIFLKYVSDSFAIRQAEIEGYPGRGQSRAEAFGGLDAEIPRRLRENGCENLRSGTGGGRKFAPRATRPA